LYTVNLAWCIPLNLSYTHIIYIIQQNSMLAPSFASGLAWHRLPRVPCYVNVATRYYARRLTIRAYTFHHSNDQIVEKEAGQFV